MKNYRLFFFTILFIAISITSCQKQFEDLTTIPGTTSSRVKTYTEDITAAGGHTSTTFNLTYDANGRLTSMISASNAGDKFIYQYSGNTITLDIFNLNVATLHGLFFLNSNSFIDSTFQYNNTKDTSTEKYIYNSNKQLITLLQYDYTTAGGAVLWETTNYTYDANGNLLKQINSSDDISYEYSTILNNFSLGTDFLPAQKFLPSKTTYVSGGATVVLTHTYTFDSNNRLIMEKIVASTGEIVLKKYTY